MKPFWRGFFRLFYPSSRRDWERVDKAIASLNRIAGFEPNDLIADYEKRFGMTTAEFLEKWKAGEMLDTFETNEWAILATLD